MYRSVWWHSPIEYGEGLQPPKTWPSVMSQYRRPTDQRYYDLPTEQYDINGLYYEKPRLGKPEYRGIFRDKPCTVTSHHPSGIETKPRGFHGRLYYEHGPPQFKYQGPQKDELYWLELPPYAPQYLNKPLDKPDTAVRKSAGSKIVQFSPPQSQSNVYEQRVRRTLSPTADELLATQKSK